METHYAVVQSGTVCYGVGETKQTAITDAHEWTDFDDSELKEYSGSNHGDLCICKCTESFFDYVRDNGGDLAWDQNENGELCLVEG